jgi:pullulanase
LDTIRVGLERPLTLAEASGKLSVTAAGRTLAIAKIEMKGEAQQPRILPRTPGRFTLAGSFQSALGGKDWDPDGEVSQMTEESPGVYVLVVDLPMGQYEYKAARNGNWNENYGRNFESHGANIPLEVRQDRQVVKFVLDFNKKTLLNSINHPDSVKAPAQAPTRPKPEGPDRFPTAVLTLARPLSLTAIAKDIWVSTPEDRRRLVARRVLDDPSFLYSGTLGSLYNRRATQFKVWSPPSSRAEVLLFDRAAGGQPKVVPMVRNPQGVWSARVSGDLHGKFYQYRFQSYGESRLATDIYSHAANRPSTRSMVVDLSRTNPPAWPSKPKLRHKSQTDAVLYEIHVRDFTVRRDSGVPDRYRGKYAGLGYRGSRCQGKPTGLDYLVNLGVTDVHLLPVHNFLTGSDDEYTWGYATNLFNVPEETYSATPNDPVGVIREFKSMVSSMHKAGLRVVLDVVYNHSWPPEGKDSNFWQTVPYYYFRTNDRGDVLNESGVGNALADERPMVRKFIRDSLLYWTNEYKVDGFRFDLIGMHYPESVRDWSRAIRRVRPDAVVYGEPWTGGGPTHTGMGAQRGSGVAVFNDRFRGAFRGDLDGSGPGFAMGGSTDAAFLRKAVTGWVDFPGTESGFAGTPQESINYISAHDNLTLRDKIARAMPTADEGLRRASLRFSGAAVLLSQGVPFLEGGAQIGRTKGGNHNSYNSGDKVNAYYWDQAPAFWNVHEWYRGLIALRRGTRAFRLSTAQEVRESVRFLDTEAGTLAWTVKGQPGDRFREYLVVMRGSLTAGSLTLPQGQWQVLADGERASINPLRSSPATLSLAPLSAWVLAR